jgi:hypothetical protein
LIEALRDAFSFTLRGLRRTKKQQDIDRAEVTS